MGNNIYTKLLNIQTKLKAPKGQYNSFGKYSYRSCEDILEALKPLLAEEKATVILQDELVQVGERYYIKAIAKFINVEKEQFESEGYDQITVTALAREEESKKGMDGSQVTGASSSYARKYALNGLFAIDDSQDSDITNRISDDLIKEAEKYGVTLDKVAIYFKTSVKDLSEEQVKEAVKMQKDAIEKAKQNA